MSTKYTKELLGDAVSNSVSIAGVLRYLNLKQAGGTQSYISNKIKQFNIDTSHFTGQGHNKGKLSKTRKSSEEILILLPSNSNRPKIDQLRRAMIESGIEHQCKVCGLTDSWQGVRLVLEVDHIDGNWLNNLFNNLRFLCPNCHSQQNTNRSWKNANKD